MNYYEGESMIVELFNSLIRFNQKGKTEGIIILIEGEQTQYKPIEQTQYRVEMELEGGWKKSIEIEDKQKQKVNIKY